MSYVYTGLITVEELKELFRDLPVKMEYKLLEQETEIKFEKYVSGDNLEIWNKGRIFGEKGEIKWQKFDGKYQTVYTGEEELPGILLEKDFNLHPRQCKSYFLWGERTAGKTDEWIELRIPGELKYPVEGHKDRVKVEIIEYDNGEGITKFYRYKALEEVDIKDESL